jgi:hypothetical protein
LVRGSSHEPYETLVFFEAGHRGGLGFACGEWLLG